MKVTHINEVGITINVFRNLQKLEKRLHRLDEKWCNGYLEEKRYFSQQNKLMAEAQKWADDIELTVFHQGDPRGCSLYLVEAINPNEITDYTKGIAIY